MKNQRLKKSRNAMVAIAAIAALALAGCSAQNGGGDKTDAGGKDAKSSFSNVSIVVPADPGGGWDQTGRTMAKVLTEDKIVKTAPVTNVGGAGGTIGLAQLATEKDPATLMVNGLVMVGAIETNASKVRLEDTTPIARLTDEPLVVVVPADSKYKDLKSLVEDIVDKGQAITVTGGSAGGADHILAGLLLDAAGVKSADIPAKLNYTPNAGGGEAVSLILGGKVAAGISGVGEFQQHIEAGKMRALAVSSEKPVEQLPDVPTITDAGYDVVLTNWRGVIAPGDISAADRAELERIVTEMHDSEAWKKELETKGWADAFLTGSELDSFVKQNISDVQGTLKNIGLI
ncbi:Bug family tripartite tricarboxylate transporter substrate binding protein [Microbacterium arabinogalactanolyticum]|uniref:Bug family tripartite tricarboxylate transporter substrate binding protein n=1 Tax=Microbacterium arabinogalactanolyticum TaxID=69365 RepID=UPI002557A9BC|nr:tripartite tricarboxylate transporter substrate binding protein [Microbacterium arabinogalactanolyticum]GLC86115.1 C4-dicarboxylate ABC transporter substrate-binding protein [Microbacterium arabinogalactanolyticum]